MPGTARATLLAAILAAGAAMAAAPKAPIYILSGYRFEGLLGPRNTIGLVAKLKHQPGARITEADIRADVDALAKELRARHIRGQLVTGTAEGDGHILVFFDLVDTDPPGARLWMSHRLISQAFEGVTGVSADAMARATGLKPGDALSPEKIVAARRAVLTLVAKSRPGKALTVKVRIQTRPHNEAALTWIIGDSNKER